MSSAAIFGTVAGIVVIATTCQLFALRLKMPALLLLLPAGFLAGVAFAWFDPATMFGSLFSPLVGVAVSLILFHGGLELSDSPLDDSDRPLVRRLVWIGGAFTWAAATLAAWALFDLSFQICLLLGAILIVSGPTVVGPLLEFVQPVTRLRRILAWEGTLIDPVGALVAVIVFSGVSAADQGSVTQGIIIFLSSLAIGVAAAVVGMVLIKVGLRLARGSDVLGTQVLFGAVVGCAGVADAVAEDSGLLAALLMGMAAHKVVGDQLQTVRPFFDTVVSIALGALFVAISASVPASSLTGLVLPTLGLIAVLVLVVRPLAAWTLSWRTTLTWRERVFLGWMAPRGIVAAATAAGFAAALQNAKIPGGGDLLPITFMVIAGTVTVYSLTAAPVAQLLGVREPPDERREEADVDPLAAAS